MRRGVRDINELVSRVATDHDLRARIQADPMAALKGLASPLESDLTIYRIVVSALAIVAIGSLGGAVGLAWADKVKTEVLTLLTAFGSGAVGALAGVLTPTRGMKGR